MLGSSCQDSATSRQVELNLLAIYVRARHDQPSATHLWVLLCTANYSHSLLLTYFPEQSLRGFVFLTHTEALGAKPHPKDKAVLNHGPYTRPAGQGKLHNIEA